MWNAFRSWSRRNMTQMSRWRSSASGTVQWENPSKYYRDVTIHSGHDSIRFTIRFESNPDTDFTIWNDSQYLCHSLIWFRLLSSLSSLSYNTGFAIWFESWFIHSQVSTVHDTGFTVQFDLWHWHHGSIWFRLLSSRCNFIRGTGITVCFNSGYWLYDLIWFSEEWRLL